MNGEVDDMATVRRTEMTSLQDADVRSMTYVAGRVATLSFVAIALAACAPTSRLPAQTADAQGNATSTNATPARSSQESGCLPVSRYAEAVQAFIGLSTFGPNKTVLLRPAEDATRIDNGTALLGRLDVEPSATDKTSQEVSKLLHDGFDTLRRLMSALDARDTGEYGRESVRYTEIRQRLSDIAEERHRICGKSVFPPIAKGRLAPETIQRVVRGHYGRFRACYDSGLARNPSLRGRITVQFTIDREGKVTSVQPATANASTQSVAPDRGTEAFFLGLGYPREVATSISGTSFPDDEVVQCVMAQYRQIQFPPPEGGVVHVVYPIAFAPQDSEQE